MGSLNINQYLIFYIALMMIINMQMNLDTLKTVEEKNEKSKTMPKLFQNSKKKKLMAKQ